MTSKEKYLVIAHYHRRGLIRSDICNLIKISNKLFKKIIFVSTNLKKTEEKKIDKFAKIIVRPNYGYDFYSWKTGIEFLKKNLKDPYNKKNIIHLIPSSLLYLKPVLFLKKILSLKNFDNTVYGLAKSWEICEHLQSDLFIFSLNLFKKKQFHNWWNKIKKFKTRQIIIYKYEIGFSQFLDSQKIKKLSIFKDNIKDYPSNKMKLMKVKITNMFFKTNKIYKKNPTHFYWPGIYKKLGIIKVELIKSNPHKVDLREFDKIFKKNVYKKLRIEALNN